MRAGSHTAPGHAAGSTTWQRPQERILHPFTRTRPYCSLSATVRRADSGAANAVQRQCVIRAALQRQRLVRGESDPDLAPSAHLGDLGLLSQAALLGAAAALLAASPAFAVADPAEIARAMGGPFVPGLLGDSPVREGFVSGFLLILFSELGDKTFFIALLLAVKYRQAQGLVFAGSFGALAVMTVISVGLGLVLHEADNIFDTGGLPLDDIVAVSLLLFFGIRTLQEAANADEKAIEEKGEAQETVGAFNDKAGLVLSTFALVFAAEWGDKSFLATIALAAASSPLGVVGGAVTGHGVATLIAIGGGKALSDRVSEKTLQYIGGSLFLLFAATQLVDLLRGV